MSPKKCYQLETVSPNAQNVRVKRTLPSLYKKRTFSYFQIPTKIVFD